MFPKGVLNLVGFAALVAGTVVNLGVALADWSLDSLLHAVLFATAAAWMWWACYWRQRVESHKCTTLYYSLSDLFTLQEREWDKRGGVDPRIAELTTERDKALERVAVVNADYSDLRADYIALGAKHAALQQHYDTAINELDQLRADLTVVGQHIDAAHRRYM